MNRPAAPAAAPAARVPAPGAASAARAAFAAIADRFGRTLAPVVFGVWLVFAFDGLTLSMRGSHPDALLQLHWASIALGAALAVAAWIIAEAAALPLRIAARFTDRSLPPSTGPALVAAVVLVIGLAPGHAALARHLLGSWLTSLYALFPAVAALLCIDALRRRAGFVAGLVGAGLLGVGFALHGINAYLFTGLYPPLHQSLAVATATALIAAFSLAFAHWSGARCAVVTGVFGLTAIGAAAWPIDEAGARSGIIFHGTESMQALTAARPWLDADGDGIPTGFAGADCDDGDATVHPLMFEVPGNGKDDNCRLGDRVPGSDPPVAVDRRAPPSPGAAAWRTVHATPDVVLLFVDTLRWDVVDAMRPLGSAPLGITPNIDRLAARGVAFTQARTTAPRTPHAWMSLIRGRFLGRTLTCRSRLSDPKRDTLVHALNDAGYSTRARLVGKSWRRFHLHGGWDSLVEGGHVVRISGPATTRDALRLLAQSDGPQAGEPLLLVAHYADAHSPYLKHPDFAPASDSLVDRYRGEVRAVDAEVGRLLAAIEARGRPTVVVLFADHGENLGDHGQKGGHHGVSVYDEVVRVPLIITAPGVAAGRVEVPVSLVDVAPTVLELTGISGLAGADGQSLARHLFREPIAAAPTVSEFYDFGLSLQAVVDGRYKLIRDVRRGSVRLFDVVADPGELHDLTGAEGEVAARLGHWLDAWVEYRVDPTERRPDRCKSLVPE